MMKYIYGSFENIVNSLCTQSVRPSLGLIANACRRGGCLWLWYWRRRKPPSRSERPARWWSIRSQWRHETDILPHVSGQLVLWLRLLAKLDLVSAPPTLPASLSILIAAPRRTKLCLWICATENGEEEKGEDQSLERRRRSWLWKSKSGLSDFYKEFHCKVHFLGLGQGAEGNMKSFWHFQKKKEIPKTFNIKMSVKLLLFSPLATIGYNNQSKLRWNN